MISLGPLNGIIRKALGGVLPDVATRAVETWEIASGGPRYVPPAIFLPGQIERIHATEFAPLDVVIGSLQGDETEEVGPTRGYRLLDVDLVDGVLYGGGAQRHLRARTSRRPIYRRPDQTMSGVLYESWVGNRWFGNWLSDDCLTYMLADDLGQPVTTSPPPKGHVPRYESLLGMMPKRIANVHFDDLILIDDFPNNSRKTERARRLRANLTAGRMSALIPGVFILRGNSGDARILANEREISDRLAEEYGFSVLDPSQATVDEIASLCGRAAIVAGVEGSHLVHGLATMPPGATLFVIQPPHRVTTALKLVTDRQEQRYAFVVAEGAADAFRADWDEIRHTLDLVLSS